MPLSYDLTIVIFGRPFLPSYTRGRIQATLNGDHYPCSTNSNYESGGHGFTDP
jgi:hypothetical protein